jgi:hypothetical protein
MSDNHRQPGIAFWFTVVLTMTLIYPLSFAAVCALDEFDLVPTWSYGALQTVYAPLIRVVEDFWK